MPEHHKVLVVRINELRTHPNADSLSLADVAGYQIVVKTSEFKLGELYVYIPPDSVVPTTPPFAFLWADKEFPEGEIPARYRRVTVRKFRGQYSEGLLLPLEEFFSTVDKANGLYYTSVGATARVHRIVGGEDVAEFLGITHFEEPEPIEPLQKQREQYKKWPPRSLKGFFYWFMAKLGIDLNGPLGGSIVKPPKNAPPVYSVESFKNYPGVFQDGEEVVVMEKVHGSCFRAFHDGDKMWVGSKNLWKSEDSNCIWRKALKENPWIEAYCKIVTNATIYAEVVPTQKGYTYGANENKPVKIFVFDVYDNANGFYLDKKDLVSVFATRGILAPILYQGPYDEAKIKPLVEGKSTLGDHLREGIVISSATEHHVRGLGRAQLKLKQNKFLEKEREG